MDIDGCAAHEALLIPKLMPEAPADSVKHLQSFSHYLWADTIAGQHRNSELHSRPLLSCLG